MHTPPPHNSPPQPPTHNTPPLKTSARKPANRTRPALPLTFPDAPRVLIIRPSALGDVCRSVPLAASLRRAFPDARIDWLVRDTCADAIREHPAVDNTVLFERKSIASETGRLRFAGMRRLLRTLREPGYDLVIDAQGLLRSGFFAWITGAPIRVGDSAARELAWLGYTRRVHIRPESHTVDRMLALLESLGIPLVRDLSLHNALHDRSWASERVLGRAVVLAPTSVWPAKRWPIDRFHTLARRLLDGSHCEQIVIVGGPGEREQCDLLLELAGADERVLDLVGQTSVGQLMAVIERATLVVANDSAAVHMAVGFHRPLIALFGPTRTSLVGPYRRDDDVIQHTREDDVYDHKSPSVGLPMMERISTAEVFDAALDRLTRSDA